MPPRLLTVAAIAHVAPAPRVITAPVEEQPSASGGGADAHPGYFGRGEQFRRRAGNRPENIFQGGWIHPTPRERTSAGREFEAGRRITDGLVQERKVADLWAAPGGHGGEDPIDGFTQPDGSLH